MALRLHQLAMRKMHHTCVEMCQLRAEVLNH